MYTVEKELYMSIRDHLRRQQLKRLYEQTKSNPAPAAGTGDIVRPNDVYRPLDSWVVKPKRARSPDVPVEPLPKKELKPAVPETSSRAETEGKTRRFSRVLSISLGSDELNEINLYLKKVYGTDAYGKRSQWIRETVLRAAREGT